MGIDYRAASDTAFDVHVRWDEVAGCQVRRSAAGGPMLCFDLHDPERIIAATSPPVTDALVGTHRACGTPIAVNLAVFKSPGLLKIGRAIDAFSGGRLHVRP